MLSSVLSLSAVLTLSSTETLKDIRFRAVTLEPNERREFVVPKLERVTAASGKCVEESAALDATSSLTLAAECSGIRTSLAWLSDGKRIYIMACAESDEGFPRTPAQLSLRKKVQAALKKTKTVTACVRNNRVELWGWVHDEKEMREVQQLEKKWGIELLRSFVERLPEGE
jgi:hypothetical protein